MDLMAANHIRRLPVQDDRGSISGWVTLADISRKLLVDSHGLQDALRLMTEGSERQLRKSQPMPAATRKGQRR